MPQTPQILLFHGLSVEDGSGLSVRGGALLVERGARSARILAVGSPAQVAAHPAATRARAVRRPRAVLIPGLVNAHTHLDLTHIGPRPHRPSDGFIAFGSLVGAERKTDPAGITQSVRAGIRLCLQSGTVAVGDIAGCPGGKLHLEPLLELRASGLIGTSFLELFGIGRGEQAGMDRLDQWLRQVDWGESGGVRAGLQPHAPYSVSPRLYAKVAAVAGRIPVATHLAENPEERRFVAAGDGPAGEFLVRLGLWDDALLAQVGLGRTPVEHLAPALDQVPFLLAHVNDADDRSLEILARSGATVVYCPRSAAYFANETHFGPHRYREMLSQGINVVLGTDSVINLPSQTGMSVFDEARFLFRRDSADPRTLLRMATENGARALGLDPAAFRFTPGGSVAGIACVEVGDADSVAPGRELAAALAGEVPAELLLAAKSPSVAQDRA